MAHAGFSVFFVAMLFAAVAMLLRVGRREWARISAALRGEVVDADVPMECKVRVCATREVPRIAARLNVRFPDGLAPVARIRRAWPFEARTI